MQLSLSIIPALLLGITLAHPASARDEAKLRQRLQAFKLNPAQAMQQIPEKRARNGQRAKPLFRGDQVRSRGFLLAKNKFRDQLSGRSAFKSNDNPSKLVDKGDDILTSLEEMEAKKLQIGEVATQPWSDYYWALYNGQTAYRYADEKFPYDTEDWKAKNDYLTGEGARLEKVDALSPAEKYDLLVGDTRKSLTNAALAEGASYYRQNGKVETWMGICHGWAPAAYMMDRPTKSVIVTAANGQKITFFPADIKALASLLWATSSPGSNFIGGRCNTKEPKTDKNGRVKDQDCFDTNPATWHLAMVNQVGISKRSMVMDATFDYEVWNQPVRSYNYSYFNPQTMEPVQKLKDALVEIKELKNDKFEKYRSKRTKYVVGVTMDMSYVVETTPSQRSDDKADYDAITEVSYEYDLELDENMNAIGGEWYSNAHPDFLWTPSPGARALTSADELLESNGGKRWQAKNPVPREWQEVAPKASERGLPLALVVEALLRFSKGSD